jgi:hypothetical protein
LEPASRTRLVALAVLLAVSAPLVVIAAAGGGSEDESGLRVEPSRQGPPEVVLYLEDSSVNTPETTDGATRVRVICTDAAGAVVFRGSKRWPFRDTDGGKFDPHVHVFVDPEVLGRISRCSLPGTDPLIEGGRPKRR